MLVTLLDSTSSSEIKEKTVTALAKISTVDSSKYVLVAEGLRQPPQCPRVLQRYGQGNFMYCPPSTVPQQGQR
nr:uncharacterized protein LOC109150621 [Ipomoea trifida]